MYVYLCLHQYTTMYLCVSTVPLNFFFDSVIAGVLICFSFHTLSNSSSLYAVPLTLWIASFITFCFLHFRLTIFFPSFVVELAVLLSLYWGLKLIPNSLGQVTSLLLGSPVVGLPPSSLWTVEPIYERLRRCKSNLWWCVTRMNNSRMPKIMLNYRPNRQRWLEDLQRGY
jgi:hypothetical protein